MLSIATSRDTRAAGTLLVRSGERDPRHSSNEPAVRVVFADSWLRYRGSGCAYVEPLVAPWAPAVVLPYGSDVRVGRHSLIGRIAIAVMLILCLSCGPSSVPAPSFSREEAIRKATAKASGPTLEISSVVVRIDRVTAELTTLAESDQRRRIQSPHGYGPGRDQNTPVWWVSVQGYFQFQGMPAPRVTAGNLYEAEERIFVYDARTGEGIGAQIPHSRPTAATPGPAVPADTLPPCPPSVPTLPPEASRPTVCRTEPSAKLYDPYRQASPLPGGGPVPTRQSYALTPGPQTCGALIQVAGRTVQLPPNACVTAYEAYVQCTAGQPCPDPPIYELRRGAASLRIEARSGTIIEQTIVPGDTSAFDFVREAQR